MDGALLLMLFHYALAIGFGFLSHPVVWCEIWHHFAYYPYHFLRFAYICMYLFMNTIYIMVELRFMSCNPSLSCEAWLSILAAEIIIVYMLDCFILYDSWAASIELLISWDVIMWKRSYVMLCGTLITLEYQWNHKDNHSKPKSALNPCFQWNYLCTTFGGWVWSHPLAANPFAFFQYTLPSAPE